MQHIRPFYLAFLWLAVGFVAIARAQSPAVLADSIKSLSAQANAAAKANDFPLAARLGKRMIALGRRDSLIFYSTALTLLLSGEQEEALRYLDTSAQLGWNNVEGWEQNPLFGRLRNEKLFQQALDRVRENARRAGIAPAAPDGDPELQALWQADQQQRYALLGAAAPPSAEALHELHLQDSIRHDQVLRLVRRESLHTGVDFERAALILQHGSDTSDYRTAHELALKAITLGDTNAKWLAAATLDRYLTAQGKPQKYGTQFRPNPTTGEMELYTVDPTTTDEERARWNVPPLAVAREQAKKMKGFGAGTEKR